MKANIAIQLVEDEVDTEDISELAKGMLTDFQNSTSLHALNDIIFLVQQSLVFLSSAPASLFVALTTLADALYARSNHSYDITDLDEAISSLQNAIKCCTERDQQQSNMNSRICGLLAARFDLMGDISDLQTALDALENGHINGTETSTGVLESVEFTNELCEQFSISGNMAGLITAVTPYSEGIAKLPQGSENYATVLNNLAFALWTQFKQGGQQSDLDEAISLQRQALELPHPNQSNSLNNLASALWTRFEQEGQQSDLDEAISLQRQALELQLPPHPNRSNSLNNLASALWTRFKQGGQQSDLDEAISLHRQALELQLPPHPNQSTSLSNFASALLTRFEQAGQLSDLNEAISLHRQALELQLPPHPNQFILLNNLANSLLIRFEQGGQQNDLNEAISLHRQALELPHPNPFSSLNNLANSLLIQFEQGGQQSDLDEAISLHRQALKLQVPSHPNWSTSLSNLANTLLTQFEQGGQQSDLNEAISLHRQALELQLPPHPNQSILLNNLTSALWTRFEQEGQRSDLDEAISLQRQALELQLPSHPNRSDSLNNLANALLTRFKQGGQQSDLNEAISLHRQALELRLPPHPHHSNSLNNLAYALSTQFEQGGQRNDLDEAISLHRQALKLFLPPHPNQSTSLNNLASVLSTRFEQAGQLSDLDEAISLHRQALELQLPPHPNRSTLLSNLANSLLIRFEQGGQQSANLNEAISLHRQALEFRLPPHPNRSDSLNNLANALSIQFEQGGQQSDLDEAVSLFLTATQYLFQSPSYRLHVAKDWIHCADRNQHISAIDAYKAALQALPQVAALSLDVESRQGALTAGSDGLARDASRCAIRSGCIDEAIEFLEAGRSIFWSQVLSLRSPFYQLHKVSPELADKLRAIATALEIGSHRDVSAEILDNRKKLSIDQESSRLNRLNEEWAASIHEVRKLQGFEDFLCPSRISSLKSAASEHPVVILIANDDGSHCLIMTSINVHHIPLPTLGTPVLHKLGHLVQVPQFPSSQSFTEETQEAILWLEECTSRKGGSINHKLGSSDDIFRYILRILWDELVSPVINLLQIKVSH
jgi:hypothetical protein